MLDEMYPRIGTKRPKEVQDYFYPPEITFSIEAEIKKIVRMKEINITNEIIWKINVVYLHPDIVDIILDNFEKDYVVILNMAHDKIKELKAQNIDVMDNMFDKQIW